MGAARKPVLPVMVVCCVLVGWLVWSAVPAVAAAPEAPGPVVVGTPGALKVVVSGVLNPHAEGQPGTYEFLYDASSTSCEGGEHAPASPGLAAGVQGEEVAQELTRLTPETEYTVCLLERNLNEAKGEEAVGPPAKFKTVGVLEAPTITTPASEITDSSIKLQGVLNPGAAGVPGTYEFVYRRSTSECQQENPETQQMEDEFVASTGAALGHEKEVVPAAPVEAGELLPNTAYTFCLLARNGAGELALSPPVTFTTLSRKPGVSGVSFSKVGVGGVTVNAQVDTGGLESMLTVEFGTTSAYGSESAAVTVPIGASTASASLSGLEPDTEYHFRVKITNTDGSETSTGDNVFRTLPVSEGLPDNRVYEMVTPPENGDSDVMIPDAENKVSFAGFPTQDPFQVAVDGSAITYPTLALTGANGAGTNGDQYLAKRSAAGNWVQSSIEPNGYFETSYQGFSADLSTGIIESGDPGEAEILPPLSPSAPGEGYKLLYERGTSETGYRPLITKAVKLNRSPSEFGSDFVKSDSRGNKPVFAGASVDFDDLLFEANDALLAGEDGLAKELEQDVRGEVAKGETNNYLYDEVGGQLSLVDVSPEGKVVPGATFGALPFVNKGEPKESLFDNPPDFSHVISADGGRMYWTDLGSGVVFVREDGSSTVQVSAGAARYWTASTDGRYALYSEGEGRASRLYRFDTEGEGGRGRREALTVANAGVLGVVGASEDGEVVYFVAEGVLSGENGEGVVPVEDQPNLYVLRAGHTPVFVATLSEQDGKKVPPYRASNDAEEWGDWQPGFGQRTARVTGDGANVVFMSNQSLAVAGYPHGYPSDGESEVYVYEAGSERLFCASCGSTDEALPSGESAAAFLLVSSNDTFMFQSISEDGDRVFFDSGVPLVSQDTNGVPDVYEWEREGHGSCAHGAGSTGGCVFLLSGGTNEANSWFVGSSPNGDDAFIVTRAQLSPEDGNDAFDLYDVRVDGVKVVTPPVCTGSGCQGVPAPAPLFATPPSVTFSGVGNFAAPDTKAGRSKLKALTRAQKLARALKECRKRRGKRRGLCEARARRLYRTDKHGKSASVTGGKHA
jgi:hypothetical protein